MDINADQDCQSICKAVENHIIQPLSVSLLIHMCMTFKIFIGSIN